MALGSSRDILFILRARDEVSRTLNSLERSFGGLSGNMAASIDRAGASAMILGGSMVAIGAAGGLAIDRATKSFMAYEQQAALTKTQMADIPVTIEEIMNATNGLYKVGAPLKELQPALYDIFSSMNVSSLEEGTKILELFAKSAVAGGTDVQTAGRAAISVMNAWGMGAGDLNHILDTQWRLVQKGVGTYEEVSDALGRALPSAQRAGQSFDQVAASMAFLTRAGLSNAMAATSTARAMDLLSNPKFRENMQKIGLDTLDASGNFKDMNVIVSDLNQKLSGLSEGERAKVLKELTTGAGGTIQAMRFLDLAVTQGQNFNSLLGEIQDSTGALDTAYGIMADTGATKTQIFKNRLSLLVNEMGERFLPYVLKGMDHVQQWMDKWDNLSDKTKDTIAKVIAIGTAFATVGGTVLLVGGAIMRFIAMFMKIGMAIRSIGGFLLPLIMAHPIIAAIVVLLAGAAYLIWKNWDTVGPKIMAVIKAIKDIALVVADAIMRAWDYLWENVPKWVDKAWDILKGIWESLVSAWHSTVNAIKTAWQATITFLANTWDQVKAVVLTAVAAIVNVWDSFYAKISAAAKWFWDEFGPGIMQVWNTLRTEAVKVFEQIGRSAERFGNFMGKVFRLIADISRWLWDRIVELAGWGWQRIIDIVNVAWPILKAIFDIAWATLTTVVKVAWEVITTIIQAAWEVIKAVVSVALNIITTFWQKWGDDLWAFIKGIWDSITDVISGAIQIVSGIIRTILAIITGDWSGAWDGIKTTLSGAWDLMLGAVKGTLALIQLAIETVIAVIQTIWSTAWDTIRTALELAWNLIKISLDGFWQILKDIFNWVKDTMAAAWDGIWEGISKAITTMWNTVKTPLETMWDILKKIAETAGKVVEKVGGFIGKVGGAFPGFAAGGTTKAGFNIVGENGPELLFSRGGDYVMNNNRSRDLLNGLGSNGGSSVTVKIDNLSVGAGADRNMVREELDIMAKKLAHEIRIATGR